METRSGEPRSEYSPPCPWKPSTCAALMGLAYLVLARFSLLFVVQPEQIAGFWLPNGLLIGVMVTASAHSWVVWASWRDCCLYGIPLLEFVCVSLLVV